MLKELYLAGLAMQNQQTRLETVANNLANASTVGYKRASVFERNIQDARANFYNVPGDLEQNDPPIGSYYDFSFGAFEKTDNPLDLAIDGKGFFLLKDSEGKDFLTRAGNFRLNEEGTIVAMDGKFLMSNEGPINLSKDYLRNKGITNENKELNIKIDDEGYIYVNELQLAKIKLVEVQNLNSLQRISNQQFILTENAYIDNLDNNIKIKQGWLENSNVNLISEMVNMIELQRMYEAGSKVIQTNDGTLDKSIGLGRFY
jgi:flagellar basal-body rod protein FlgG